MSTLCFVRSSSFFLSGVRLNMLVVGREQRAHDLPFFSIEQKLPGLYSSIRLFIGDPKAIIEKERCNGAIIPDAGKTRKSIRLIESIYRQIEDYEGDPKSLTSFYIIFIVSNGALCYLQTGNLFQRLSERIGLWKHLISLF
jgi:hypothetical protein